MITGLTEKVHLYSLIDCIIPLSLKNDNAKTLVFPFKIITAQKTLNRNQSIKKYLLQRVEAIFFVSFFLPVIVYNNYTYTPVGYIGIVILLGDMG
jgi:integral membrane sensor domain MASE1